MAGHDQGDADKYGLSRALLASTPIAVAVFDQERRYVYVNTAYSNVAPAAAGVRPGRHVAEVFPGAASEFARAIDEALAGRATEFSFHVEPGAAGAERHWVGVAFPLDAGSDGRPLVGTMMRDITSRTRAERERQVALGREQLSRIEAERQRDFLRMVLENAPMGISVCEGPDHVPVLISDFATRIVGMPREQILNRPLSVTFPEAFSLVRQYYDRVYVGGETVTVPDQAIPLPDGRVLSVYSCYAPVMSDGSPVGVMALSLDTSALKRAQQLVESQKRILQLMAEGHGLTTILETIAAVVATFTTSGAIASILLASPDGRRLQHGAASGLAPGYWVALGDLPIGPDGGSCGSAAAARHRVVVGDIATDARWARYRDIAATWGVAACWSTPILGAAGNLLGTFAIYYPAPTAPAEEDLALVDLLVPLTALAIERCRADEERQRLFDAERRARQDAEAASRSKDEFVATLSHELRTPLNAILGWTRLLRTDEMDPEHRARALESIERNTRAQSQLVEDLLDMSRIITGKLRLDVRSVELSTVIEAALDAVRPAADAKSIRLQKVLDPRAAPIAGDPDRLQQVIWNLLSNAIKFTPKGERVQVRLERVNSHVEILISDTGAGIAPDMLPRIFDRFQQGEEAGGPGAGLGLGLAIARHLVELHGGTIHASSDGPGQGSTFTVKLPVMVARGDRSPSDAHPTAGGRAVPLPALPPIRILVVEDDEDGREMVASVLSRSGAEVRTASAAADGFSLVRDWRPHVLISDIEMPGEDGYAFIGRLRGEEWASAREVPAIALTAYARVEDRIRALAAGFQMHVPKPVEPAELIAVIKAVLSQTASAAPYGHA